MRAYAQDGDLVLPVLCFDSDGAPVIGVTESEVDVFFKREGETSWTTYDVAITPNVWVENGYGWYTITFDASVTPVASGVLGSFDYVVRSKITPEEFIEFPGRAEIGPRDTKNGAYVSELADDVLTADAIDDDALTAAKFAAGFFEDDAMTASALQAITVGVWTVDLSTIWDSVSPWTENAAELIRVMLALAGGMNSVVQYTTYHATSGNPTAGTITIYNTRTNAAAAGITGKIMELNFTQAYNDAGGEQPSVLKLLRSASFGGV